MIAFLILIVDADKTNMNLSSYKFFITDNKKFAKQVLVNIYHEQLIK